MKKEVAFKREVKVFEKYLVLILMAILFMSVAFASITDVALEIGGNVTATVQEGIFITNVSVAEQGSVTSQSINYYRGTTFSNTATLSGAGSITYQITLYNNTGYTYYFTEITNDSDNSNVSYSLSGLEPNVTAIGTRETVTFNLTFTNNSSSSQTINSIMAFKFDNTYINFTVDRIKYSVPSGSTWQQFIDSQFNTASFNVGANDYVHKSEDVIILNTEPIFPEETIIENATYETEKVVVTIQRKTSSSITLGENAIYSVFVSTNGSGFRSIYFDYWECREHDMKNYFGIDNVSEYSHSASMFEYTVTIGTDGMNPGWSYIIEFSISAVTLNRNSI